MKPIRCLFGRHQTADVINRDGSVTFSTCMRCMDDRAPVRPRPEDPIQAKWMADVSAALAEYFENESPGESRETAGGSGPTEAL